jgi:argonaute-like protein
MFPHSYRLRRPRYCYSEAGDRTHEDKLRGLLTHAPLRPARVTEPRCLFVFLDEDRDHANQLYLALRNGIAQFPGCKRLTGISLERDRVESLRIDGGDGNDLPKRFADAIGHRLASASALPDLALVIYTKQPDPDKDPYPAAKAILTRFGVPSQYISWELLDAEQQFRYAVSNLALNIFVKLGGVPWSVSLKRERPTLVLGIGRAVTKDPTTQATRRRIGFATCVLSNGVYLNTSFFPPADTHHDFLVTLRSGLAEALEQQGSELGRAERLTIHVSQFEKRDVIRVVRETVTEHESVKGLVLPFEIVRLSDKSDFAVFDTSDEGYIAEEGTVVALGQAHALLVTEGRREKAVWRGRKPVTLEIHREESSMPGLSMRDTIEDAFALSSVNWRGFNAVTQPVTLQYAQLLAHQIEKMARSEPDIASILQGQKGLNTVPWFV